MKNLLLLLAVHLMTFCTVNGQSQAKKVALVYDVSYSMQTKDVLKEFAFLDSYFSQNPNVNLVLKTFSNTVILESNYTIQNANWDALKQELSNTVYDGGSNFDNIIPINVDEVIFITDGITDTDDLPKTFGVPVNIISITQKNNESQLRDLALSSGGVFFGSSKLKELETLQSDKSITVTGVVNDAMGPLANATVYASDTNQKTITDAQGNYAIVGKQRGTLEFSYLGKNSVMTTVPAAGVKNVQLRDSNELLDEVVVNATVDKEEELVNTGNQMQDKKRLGYAIETITDKEISSQDVSVERVVAGQFSNINLKSDQNIKQFLARGNNMTMLLDQTGLIVIDGIPIDSSPYKGDEFDISDAAGGVGIGTEFAGLDPTNIASVTVLKGLAATNKWGTLGRNGVILITTKNALEYKGDQKKEIVLGTTATYDGDAAITQSLPNTPYIKALQATSTIDEAYDVYLAQRKTYGSDATFFIDVASYFKNWNNPFMFERILSNVNELDASLEDLYALAYKYQELELNKQAVATYERIKNINPSNVQAHRNLALAYVRNRQLNEALEIYKAFSNNTIPQVSDFGTLRKTMVSEFKNLLALNKGSLKSDGVDSFYLNNITYSTRVIFEWSEFDALFDLQIVNPQKRFFTWSHTPQAQGDRMRKEQTLGYGLEEYFMTSSDTGEWLFNVTYYGKNGGDAAKPTFLKITTISNFGKANQSERVKVISLLDEGNSQTVLSLDLK